jgi:Gpi18-like mannosyltransferase
VLRIAAVNLNPKAFIQSLPRSVKLAVLAVLLSKVLVFAIGYAVSYSAPQASFLSVTMNMFNHWDAPHYQAIAQNWYVSNPSADAYNFIVFFPLYPILIHAFTFNYNYVALSALIVANVCSLFAFVYLYKLAKLEFGEGAALKAVLFLSIFPVAYFFSAPYTEGLFFALVIASIYYARLGKWYLAGPLGMFAALTRLEGLLLLPALAVEYLHQTNWKPRKIRPNFAWIFLPFVGWLIYLGINVQVTGNPFTYMSIEWIHWYNKFDPILGVQNAYYASLSHPWPDNLTLGIAPLIFAAFGLFMMGVAVYRRMRPVYITYMFFSWALAVGISWWISEPRYIMAMFPTFLILGSLTSKKWVNIAIAAVLLALLCFFTALFASGAWAF